MTHTTSTIETAADFTFEVRVPGQTAWESGIPSYGLAVKALREARDAGLSNARIYRVLASGDREEADRE